MRRAYLVVLILGLSGCGDEPLTVEELLEEAAVVFDADWLGEGEEEAYGNSQSVKSLEIPPGLSPIDARNQLGIPSLSSASKQRTSRTLAVLPNFLEMKVRREGTVRWLEVGSDPVTLWPYLRLFFEEQGFELSSEAPLMGVLETRWRESPDVLTVASTSQTGAPYYAASREKFRLRLEREPNAYTNVFMAQRVLTVAGVDAQQTVVWKTGLPDPDREAEMLVRLMEHLGASRVAAAATLEEETAVEVVGMGIQYVGGVPVLAVEDKFSRVWRQVGVALDRSGLFVEDSDREQGLYVIRYWSTALGSEDSIKLEVHLLVRGADQTLVTAHHYGTDEPLATHLTRDVLRHILAAYVLLPKKEQVAEKATSQ